MTSRSTGKTTKLNITLGVLTITVIILTIILASVPPISRDALVHHLAVPKIYLNHMGMIEIPSMDFSYFPMNLDLLYLIPLYFEQPIAAKYIHFVFALLTSGLLLIYLKEALNLTYGLIGALLFLTTPVIVKLSVTAYVDLGLIFFSWSCLYYFLKWLDEEFKSRYLVFSSIACGLALGTKYNGLILLMIMLAFVPLVYSFTLNRNLARTAIDGQNSNSFKGVQCALLFLLIATIVYSPWMIRNIAWTGNPVYPLFRGAFNPQTNIETGLPNVKKPIRSAFWTRRYVHKESFAQTITIPIRAFFQGKDDNPKYFDGKLNPALLFLSLVAFIRLRKQSGKSIHDFHRNILAMFVFLFILFVLFRVDFRIRYISPIIPALVVLSIFGIKNIVDMIAAGPPLVRRLGWVTMPFIVFFTFFSNGKYIYEQFDYIQPMEYLSGRLNRDEYVSRYRAEHPVVMYANQTLPSDARVLCLFVGKRTFYIEREVHLARDFYKREKGTYTEQLIAKRLKRFGTTHVIFNRDQYLRWAKHLPPHELEIFEKIFNDQTTVLKEINGVQLLTLKS
jgi:hypothetical protein